MSVHSNANPLLNLIGTWIGDKGTDLAPKPVEDENNGILGVPFGAHQIRFVTHLDFTDEMLEETVSVLRKM